MRHREDALAPARAGGDARAAGGEAQTAGGVGGGQARNVRQNHCRNGCQRDAHPDQAPVHGQIQRADGETSGVTGQDSDHGLRDGNAQPSAHAAEQKAFGEQHAAERAWAGSERCADGKFAFATHRARKNQVGNVAAGNDEDQP